MDDSLWFGHHSFEGCIPYGRPIRMKSRFATRAGRQLASNYAKEKLGSSNGWLAKLVATYLWLIVPRTAPSNNYYCR